MKCSKVFPSGSGATSTEGAVGANAAIGGIAGLGAVGAIGRAGEGTNGRSRHGGNAGGPHGDGGLDIGVGLVRALGGHASDGVTSAPAVMVTTASNVPPIVIFGVTWWVMTMVSLLANRRARRVETPKPTAGTGAASRHAKRLVSSRATAYARRADGISVVTHASQQRSASSRSWRRAHQTTGCHQ